MPSQILNLTKLKSNYKIILIAVLSLVLLVLFLTQKKIFFFLAAAGASIITSLIMGWFGPMKLVGIELVTFSTILVGSFFGSVVGAIFGVSLLVIHLIAAKYSGGPYIAWVLPEYALIGILSGFLANVNLLVAMVAGANLIDIILTLAFYRENFMKTLIFCTGNIIFNAILILNFFNLITTLIV